MKLISQLERLLVKEWEDNDNKRDNMSTKSLLIAGENTRKKRKKKYIHATSNKWWRWRDEAPHTWTDVEVVCYADQSEYLTKCRLWSVTTISNLHYQALSVTGDTHHFLLGRPGELEMTLWWRGWRRWQRQVAHLTRRDGNLSRRYLIPLSSLNSPLPEHRKS